MNDSASPQPDGLRILFADDTLSTALVTIAYLKQSGYRVDHVGDGAQAVAAFAANPPDLVLMDVVMPVMDGIEATRRIKAMTTDHWVPVIMITGLTDKKDLIAGLQAGADDYLIKPVDPHELNARIRAMLRIIDIQRRLHGILDHAFDGIVGLDEQGNIQSFNLAAERVFGYGAHEIIGKSIATLLPFPESNRPDTERPVADYLKTQSKGPAGNSCKLDGRRRNGARFMMQLAVTEIRRPEGAHFLCLIRDISHEETARRRIEFLAHHDQLTGLPNRASFSDRLDAACRRAHEAPSAVLFIDLDGFKPVNDRFGHDVGDAALQIVAKRLRGTLDSRDYVARLGGDEFVVLLADIDSAAVAAMIGQRLIDSIGQPMQLHGQSCALGASIGVALISGPAPEPERVLSEADHGMYAAKRAGKNRVALANHGMNA